jgi:SAM-dependent methyltransferase
MRAGADPALINMKDIAPNVSQLWEIITGYQRARVLFTFVELDIPGLLHGKQLSAAEAAEIKKIHPLAMERFLNACVIAGLLESAGDGLFSNTELSETLLVKDAEFYLGGITKRHGKRSYNAWENLTEKLMNWNYGAAAAKAAPEAEDQGAEAMAEQHNLALLNGFALAKAFDFSKYGKVLDLGGGTAATSIALCRTYPQLQSTVFDLPENTGIARNFIDESNLQERVRTVSGDFKKDNLPADFDVALLANFMSVADAEDNKKLLREIYGRLSAGGVCILSGWIIDNSHLSPAPSVLFCLEDICWDAPDVERSQKVYSGWLEEAGFTGIECETYLYPTKLLYGFKT